MVKPGTRMERLLAKWPISERSALEDAFASGNSDLDSDGDPDSPHRAMAAEWAQSTRLKNVEFYTRWIEFLAKNDALDTLATPSARAGKERVQDYVKSLDRVSSITRAMYVEGLRDTLRIIDPHGDYRFLSRQVRRLYRNAKASRDQRHISVSPSEMFYAGIDYMKKSLPAAQSDIEAAERFQDGLMIATIACKAPSARQLRKHADRNKHRPRQPRGL